MFWQLGQHAPSVRTMRLPLSTRKLVQRQVRATEADVIEKARDQLSDIIAAVETWRAGVLAGTIG